MVRTKRLAAPHLGERIERLMEEKRLTQPELSARTGISVSYLNRIIRGEVLNPTVDFALRIADALGVTVSELLGQGTRRWHAGALASPPLSQSNLAPETIGEKIDEILEEEELNGEELAVLEEALTQQVRQLTQLIKFNRRVRR